MLSLAGSLWLAGSSAAASSAIRETGRSSASASGATDEVLHDKPDLAISKRHLDPFTLASPSQYELVVRNAGNQSTSGTVTVRDTLPAGLTFISAEGKDWTFKADGPVVTATREVPFAPGDKSVLTLTVLADVGKCGPCLTNTATVSGGGDRNLPNNRATDTVCFDDGGRSPDLTIDLVHENEPCVGDTAKYWFNVTNLGPVPTSGSITVVDTLPAGLSFERAEPFGWTIEVQGNVVRATHPGPLAPGDDLFFALHLLVGPEAYPDILTTGTVSGGGDQSPNNNRDTDKLPVCSSTDLTIDKRHTEDFAIGRNGTFTIVVRNEGSFPSSGAITVRDTLPAGLGFVSGAGAGWSIAAAGPIVTATHPGPLAPGDSIAFTLTVSVGAAAAPEVENSATVSGGGDRNPKNNRDTDRVPVVSGAPDLGIQIRHDGPTCVGDTARYVVRVTNVGSAASAGTITVLDTLPAGLAFVDATGDGWTFEFANGVLRATHAGPLAAGGALEYAFRVVVLPAAYPAATVPAALTNPGDANPANDRATDTQSFCAGPDLAVRIRHLNEPCVGDTARFRVVVTNVGDRTAPPPVLVNLSDLPPSVLGLPSGAGWTFETIRRRLVAARYGTALAPGDSAAFEYSAFADSTWYPQLVTNVSIVYGADADTSNNHDRDVLPVCARPDLAIALDHTNPNCADDVIEYRVRVSNVGIVPTSGTITVRDTMPAGLTFGSAEGAGWTFDFSNGVLVATHPGPLAPGGELTFRYTARVEPDAPAVILNAATVSGGGERNTANNRDTDSIPRCTGPDLTIDKRHTQNFTVGQNGTYTIVVANVGTAATTGAITVRDTLPAGLSFVSGAGAGWTIGANGAVVTATHAGPLAIGDSLSFSLIVGVSAAAIPSVTNAATVNTPGDNNPTNDRDTDPTPVSPAQTSPDLTIDKRHTQNFTVGQNGTYTIVVTNVGTAATTSAITVRDTLPSGLTFVSASGTGWTIGSNGALVTATHAGPLAIGDSLSFSLTVGVSAAAIPSVTNAATVSTPGDNNPGNDRDTDPTPVSPAQTSPDLTIDKRHTQNFTVGQNGTYTIVVTNVGTAATTGAITVRDTLPAGLSFVSGTGAGWTIGANGAVVTATHAGPLAIGDSLSFSLTVGVSAAAVPGVTNAATVNTPGDNNPTNDRDTDPTPVSPAQTAPDLGIDKSHEGSFIVGQNGTYTIVVTNVGTAATTGAITVRDTLPAGLTFVSGSGTGWTIGSVGAVVTATHPGPLAVSASLDFKLVVAVGPEAVPSVTNAATVQTPGDGNPRNDRDTDPTPVLPQGSAPDLAIDKRHVQDFVVGRNGTYTIVVRNVGTAPTTGAITVRDTLPSTLAYLTSSGDGWTIAPSGLVVIATHPGPLAVGDSLRFTVTCTVSELAVPGVVNAATVNTPGDNNPTNDRDVDPTPVAPRGAAPDLAIDKRHTVSFAVGQQRAYTIVVRNVGTNSTTGTITVLDTLPNGLTFVNGSGAGWTLGANGAVVTATHPGPLAVGDSLKFAISVSIGPAAAPSVTNAATVRTPGDDNPTNDRDVDPTPVSGAPILDLAIDKSHAEPFPLLGFGTYRIAIRNVGETTTTGDIVVTDVIPVEFQYQSATGAGWSFVRNGRTLTATHPGPLAPGDSLVFSLSVRVLLGSDASVVNTATVHTPGDDNPANDTDSDPTEFAFTGPLVIEKQASPTTVEIGDVVNYTITVHNQGSLPVRNVVVRDRLPAGVRYVAGSATLDGRTIGDPGRTADGTLEFAIGRIEARTARTLRYRATVGAGVSRNGPLVNIAIAEAPRDTTTTPVTPGRTSNTATAAVRVTRGPFADEGLIAGKVFLDCDCDSNGVQDAEELGIPGVRLFLEDGSSAVTDAEGKYSFERVRPRLHVLRVDPTTLPPGAVLRPIENRHALDGESRFVDLRRGELHRADFSPFGCDAGLLAAVKDRRRAGEVSGPFVEGVSPVTAAAPAAPDEGGFGLAPSETPVVADGESVLPVALRVPGDAASRVVTLETTIGTWTVPDEDPVTPGTQFTASGGEQTIGLRAPHVPAAGRIRATLGERERTLPVRFVPSLRSWFLAGVLEGRYDGRSLDDAELWCGERDAFEDPLRDGSDASDDGKTTVGGRGALFAKGPVGRDALLTLRYDSERDPDRRRFRDMSPLEGYDVFGDASVHEYDAQSTSRLYARLDRGRSYALYGDFVTPGTEARQLGAFTRTLNGGLAHGEARGLGLTGWVTDARDRQRVDEFPGRGVSGPYALSQANGLSGTEVVEILTRDRNQPSRILRRETKTRFADYTLDPFTGQIVFRQPVPSLDSDLNPVSIRVIYEVESTLESHAVYGGELAFAPDPRAQFGVGVARDDDPLTPFSLGSAHATLKPLAGVTLGAEGAYADSGSASFGGTNRSNAWRADARLERGGVFGRVYGQRVDGGFQNASSGFLPGRDEFGADARVAFGPAALFARALRTEDRTSGGRRDGLEGGVARRFAGWNGELAVRHAEETTTPATTASAGTTPNDFTSLRGRLARDLPLPRPASVFGELERSLDDADVTSWTLGADAHVAPRTRLYVRHEDIDAFDGPFALNGAQERKTTLVGIASDELRDGHVFTEYRSRDAFAGRETQAAMGLRNRWQPARGVRVDGSLEHVFTMGGLSPAVTAVTTGFEATRDPRTKLTARVEFRESEGNEQWLLGGGLARKLDRDWTLLGRSQVFLEDDQQRVQARSHLGLAWRQTDRNRWDALARYEHAYDRDEVLSPETKRSAHVLSTDLNWHPARAWTFGGKAAAKWREDRGSDAITRTDAQLFAARAIVDLSSRFDAGVTARGLYSDHFDVAQTGLGGELGAILLKNLRLGVGYNVFGFRDEDLALGDCTDRGPYARLGFKFDETLFGAKRTAGAAPRPLPVREALESAARANAPATAAPLTPLARRVTDEAIATDLANLDAWQRRLDALATRADDPWRVTAARRWLDIARIEYTDDDDSGFAAAAFDSGRAQVLALESGAPKATRETVPSARPMPGAPRVREDLWNRLESLKRDPGFECAAEEIARLETELAYAGNEETDQGECEAGPHALEAERLARDAAEKEAACARKPAVPPIPPVAPVTPVAPEAPEDLPAPGELGPGNVHFKFDDCDLTAEAQVLLDKLVSLMRRYPNLKIQLVGHTDSRGTDAYNQGLAECRLCAVASYLDAQGVAGSRVQRLARGESELLTRDRSRYAHARNRRVEIVVTDSRGRPIAGDPEERDLQVEPAGPRSGAPRPAAPFFPEWRVTECSR